MPVLVADDRIPKIGKPSDVAKLLAGCEGERPKGPIGPRSVTLGICDISAFSVMFTA